MDTNTDTTYTDDGAYAHFTDETRHATDADGGVVARWTAAYDALIALRPYGYYPAPVDVDAVRVALAVVDVFAQYEPDDDYGDCTDDDDYRDDVRDALAEGDGDAAYDALTEYAAHVDAEHVTPYAIAAAGWEQCYHRDVATWHYNVKTGYGDAWRGFHAVIDAVETERETCGAPFNRERVEELGTWHDDATAEWWWGDTLPEAIERETGYRATDARYASCGRSGGYVNVRGIETDAAAMVRLAGWLAGQVDYYRSAEYGRDAAGEVIDRYDDETMQEVIATVERSAREHGETFVTDDAGRVRYAVSEYTRNGFTPTVTEHTENINGETVTIYRVHAAPTVHIAAPCEHAIDPNEPGAPACGGDVTGYAFTVSSVYAPWSWRSNPPAALCPDCRRVHYPASDDDRYDAAVTVGARMLAVNPDPAPVTAVMRSILGPLADTAAIALRRGDHIGDTATAYVYPDGDPNGRTIGRGVTVRR
jgi:hypothetical protein